MNASNTTTNKMPRYIPQTEIKNSSWTLTTNGREPVWVQKVEAKNGSRYERTCTPMACAITNLDTGESKIGPTDWQVAIKDYMTQSNK